MADKSLADLADKVGLSPSPCLRRVCSWKLSRPSLRRKSRRLSGSEPEDADYVPLNNSHGLDHSACNGHLLASIRNDTQVCLKLLN